VLFIYRDEVQKIANFGYGGIFILSILSNATLILPLPGIIFTSAMGAVFNPFWVAIAAGIGAAIGETTGYLAGFSGQIVVDRKDWYETLTQWMRKYGNLTILVMAFVPNPLFDLAGMAAGMLKLPFFRFLFWCSMGKIIKMLVFAYTGASLFKILIP
jgi:membrane protein DedA with SNARE-associated domain